MLDILVDGGTLPSDHTFLAVNQLQRFGTHILQADETGRKEIGIT